MPDELLTSRFPLLPEVLSAETADVYFLRTRAVLAELERDPVVGMTIFPGRHGVFCGVLQVVQLLEDTKFDGELWSLPEGTPVRRGQSVLQLRGRYSTFGPFETAMLGILASCTGWASAAREVVEAAGDVPVVSFGARHLHPNVAGIMDWAATVGGCMGCSTPLGARLSSTEASGTMPHAYMLIVGDTVEAARAFDAVMPPDVPRVVLVDTFQDEVVESLRVASSLRAALQGVRLDTPAERGGVTPGLVKEVRARLDQAGFTQVKIVISGGVTPQRILQFREEGPPVDSFGVGSIISGAPPVDYTADIREINGQSVAKRGRLPGMPPRDDLVRLLPR